MKARCEYCGNWTNVRIMKDAVTSNFDEPVIPIPPPYPCEICGFLIWDEP